MWRLRLRPRSSVVRIHPWRMSGRRKPSGRPGQSTGGRGTALC